MCIGVISLAPPSAGARPRVRSRFVRREPEVGCTALCGDVPPRGARAGGRRGGARAHTDARSVGPRALVRPRSSLSGRGGPAPAAGARAVCCCSLSLVSARAFDFQFCTLACLLVCASTYAWSIAAPQLLGVSFRSRSWLRCAAVDASPLRPSCRPGSAGPAGACASPSNGSPRASHRTASCSRPSRRSSSCPAG